MRNNNGKTLFLFGDSGSDYKTMQTSPFAKIFLTMSKYKNAHALVHHYNRIDITDRENITYVKNCSLLKRKPIVSPIVEIIKNLLWIRTNKPSLVIMSGAPHKQDFRFLYPLLMPKQKFVLIMATPSVHKNKFMRYYLNYALKFTLLFYSDLLVERYWRFDHFKLSSKKTHIIDPAFHDFGFAKKDFSTLKLVYVGVLSGRGIENTIEGLAMFIKANPNIKVSYDIFGKAKPNEIEELKNEVKKHNLNSIVTCHGFLPMDEAAELIKECNVGIAYTANTGYYGHSSAKTLEYLIAGLPVIATFSPFKNDFVNESTGVTHEDNPEAFAKALKTIYLKRNDYKPEDIRNKHLRYTMDRIVQDQIIPLFNSIVS